MQLAMVAAKIREGLPTTPEEQELWNQWVSESALNQHTAQQLTDRKWLVARMREFDQQDTAAATRAIFSALGIPENQPRTVLYYVWRVAAAVILMLCATAVMKYYTTSPVTPVIAKMPAGSNRAILTLADGGVVALDAAHNGVVSRQGGAVVTKTGSALDYSNTATEKAVMHTLSTPPGSQFELRLPDGSKVWLNSASSLIFPTAFTGSERVVKLRGEAYFEITQDVKRPFKVNASEVTVEVLGTSFNVNAYTDEAQVLTTLATGKVRVAAGKASVLLTPGEQAVTTQATGSTTSRMADIRKVTAWKNGMFEFNDADLPAILREIARWYNVQIVYQTTAVPYHYGGGIGRNQQLQDVLDMLEASGPNKFRVQGNTVYVLSTSQP